MPADVQRQGSGRAYDQDLGCVLKHHGHGLWVGSQTGRGASISRRHEVSVYRAARSPEPECCKCYLSTPYEDAEADVVFRSGPFYFAPVPCSDQGPALRQTWL